MFSINGIEWRLEFVLHDSDLLIRSDRSKTIGVTDNLTKTIYIDETLRGDLLKKVLCHELTHAAIFSYGVELDLMQEELLADLIATYGQEIISITNKIFERIKGRRQN